MSLTPKEKELVSVGASLAAGCRLCANHHFRVVRKAGASDEEIEQAMNDAIAVRDSAKKIMETHGFKLLRRKDRGSTTDAVVYVIENTTRIRELVSIAAAFSVNCESNTEAHIAAAHDLGVSDDDIESAVDTARFIKGKADSYCCKLI